MNIQHHTYRPIAVRSLFTAHHSQAENYAFASKERDTETGLSVTSLRSVSSLPLGHFRTSSNGTRWLRRFGARYYSSDLSIWLSVDPMSGKYPHQSNYVYCSNNPIKVIDPNGEDEYEFDESGNLVNLVANSEKDQIHVVDEKGLRISSSDEYQYGTIYNVEQDEPEDLNVKGSSMIFEVSTQEVADELFVFLADNTVVEWHELQAEDKDGNCHNFLGTNHDEHAVNIAIDIERRGYSIDRKVHNHPNNIHLISRGDHNSVTNLERRNPYSQSYLYTSLIGRITRYDSNTPYMNENNKMIDPK